MMARLSSAILLTFLSSCWLPILHLHVLGGAVVCASAPSKFGSKLSHGIHPRRESNDQVMSTVIGVTGGERKVVEAIPSSPSSSEVLSATPDEASETDSPLEESFKTIDEAPATDSPSEESSTNTDETAEIELPSDSHSMGSPESLKLKPRVVSLNIMVAGLAGLGKTTLCRALLDAWWEEIQEDKGDSGGKIDKTKGIARLGSLASSFSSSLTQVASSTSSSTNVPYTRARRTISTTAISPSAPFEYFDEKANTILRVRIIDTPGFGNRVNHRNSVKPIIDYISDCRRKRFRREKSPSSKQSKGDDDANNRLLVHVCLYFLSPGRFLAIDRHFLKHVQDEVTIVPVIAKADTMTDDEIARYRAELTKIWEEESIGVYSLDERNDRIFKFGRSRNVNRPNVASSNSETFYRGRRPGEVLAIISRDGMYPWGHSCALTPEHSDLKLIRDNLLSEHTERFLELATAKYVAYRDAQIAKQSRSEVLKYLALVGLAAIQLGRLEIKGTELRDVFAKGLSTFAPLLQQLKSSRRLQELATSLKFPKGDKETSKEENEAPEPARAKGFRLFGKSSSDLIKEEPENAAPEPAKSMKRAFGFFGKKTSTDSEVRK